MKLGIDLYFILSKKAIDLYVNQTISFKTMLLINQYNILNKKQDLVVYSN